MSSGGLASCTGWPGVNRDVRKVAGEALTGQGQFVIEPEEVAGLAGEVAAAKGEGHELCVVVGGGNIFRGLAGAAKGMDRVQGDYMGMLATVINGMALQGALEDAGIHTRLQSEIEMDKVAEPYIKRK